MDETLEEARSNAFVVETECEGACGHRTLTAIDPAHEGRCAAFPAILENGIGVEKEEPWKARESCALSQLPAAPRSAVDNVGSSLICDLGGTVRRPRIDDDDLLDDTVDR